MKMKNKIPRQLLESFQSKERFPINLEWLVIPMKYKHISSLTTHLKRHFFEGVDYEKYKEEAHGQRTTWVYYVTTKCFRGICNYCRHSDRKKIAQHLLDESENCFNLLHFNPQLRVQDSESPSDIGENDNEGVYSGTDDDKGAEGEEDYGMHTETDDNVNAGQEESSCESEVESPTTAVAPTASVTPISSSRIKITFSTKRSQPPPSSSSAPSSVNIREFGDKHWLEFIPPPLPELEFLSYNFFNSGSPPLVDLEDFSPSNGNAELDVFMDSLEKQRKDTAPIVRSQRPAA